MNITVERLDDVNFIISGEIDKKIIEANIEKLKAEAEKMKEETKKEIDNEMKDDGPVDDNMVNDVLNSMNQTNFERDGEGQTLKEFIDAGLKQAEINVDEILGQPSFKTYEQRDNSIYLEIEMATAPVVNTEVEYMDIVPKFKQPMAPAEEIEAKLKELAVQQAPFTAIETPRAIVDGDVAVIDFEGFLDGVAFEGGSAEKFNLRVGSNSFIPGFEPQLIGMEYGEERTITVTFPEEYNAPDLAGKETEFKVKLHEIQEQKYVEPDDVFAQAILKNEKATLDELKQKLSDQINSQALSSIYQNELKPQIIKSLLKKFDFILPNNVVEQEIDAKAGAKIQNMSKEEQETYQKDKDKFHALRESVRQEAQNAIKIALIVEALAKKQGLEVDEQETLSALYYQAMMSGQDANELVEYYKKNNLMTSAKMGLTEDKLFGQMLGFDKR
jgi:trigger factor